MARLLWNPKVHYCVHKGLPVVPVLSQMNRVHKFSSLYPTIHSDISFSIQGELQSSYAN